MYLITNIVVFTIYKTNQTERMRTLELFAGVGGFRIGLEKAGHEVVWSNQWEPGTSKQWASKVYETRFGSDGHSNEDIGEVRTEDIPAADLLVGGFPCQDYSVASTSRNSKGLVGKKGVLWWQIHRILEQKGDTKPDYLLLENVDRLLKSPSKQRGRDFAVILKSLEELGYDVEWRVINAADYGMPQKRKRVFILGYNKGSHIQRRIEQMSPEEWLEQGTMASSFEADLGDIKTFTIEGSLTDITNDFTGEFLTSGILTGGKVTTAKHVAVYEGHKTLLKDIMIKDADERFYIQDTTRWEHYKSGKKEPRTTKEGHQYFYSEGALAFPDPTDRPARTILTSEGGSSASRTKHAVKDEKGIRRLTPVELERANMFPDNHTLIEGIPDAKRGFLMGNALVVGIVERIGKALMELDRVPVGEAF
jgi:DNA (cytosine-5)-methyltransferase 1